MRRLTVVSVAYPFAPVGPDAVGGAEQILSAIDKALVSAGHRSIVIAVRGSTASGELRTYPPAVAEAYVDEKAAAKQYPLVVEVIRRTLAEVSPDVVHMHGIDFYEYLPPPGLPVLVTLHLPLSWYSQRALEPERPFTWLNCVSADQAARMHENSRALPHITNGVDVKTEDKRCAPKKNYLLMLARVCPEKGQHLALEAAHAADRTLLLCGGVFPYKAHRDYFRQLIQPRLDQKRRFLGPVGGMRKRGLLAGAACLLVPSLAPETSSLVAMEAASTGTPVIAFRSGALAEVVEDGVSGLLVDDVQAMVEALERVNQIDPDACRAVARQRFGVEKMTCAYLARYSELAQSATRAA